MSDEKIPVLYTDDFGQARDDLIQNVHALMKEPRRWTREGQWFRHETGLLFRATPRANTATSSILYVFSYGDMPPFSTYWASSAYWDRFQRDMEIEPIRATFERVATLAALAADDDLKPNR